MAFVAEDGTGLSNANSLVSVSDFDAYCTDRGHSTILALDVSAKQILLIQATDYIRTRFKYRGSVYNREQRLPFPRVIDGEELIPENAKEAVYEYAIRAHSAELAPDPVYATNGRQIIRERDKTGPLDEEYEYSQTVQKFRPYPMADSLLRDYVRSGNRVTR